MGVNGLRLVCGQAPWEMRTERPVTRLPPWHPSPRPAGLSFLLACSTRCSPTGCSVGLSPNICPHWAQKGGEAGKPSCWQKRGLGRCLGQGCTLLRWGRWGLTGLHGHLSGAAGQVAGPWAVSGGLEPWCSSALDPHTPPSHRGSEGTRVHTRLLTPLPCHPSFPCYYSSSTCTPGPAVPRVEAGNPDGTWRRVP